MKWHPGQPAASLALLEQQITNCASCPRLRAYAAGVCETRRKAFAAETYWGRPVAGWGDPGAWLLLVGLAPAAHGALRTGRMFTGDRSGDFLFAALHRAGFCNQASSRSRGDGLRLQGAWLSAAARCAPPGNRPAPEELRRCLPYLQQELALLPRVRVIISLGQLGHAQLLRALGAPPPLARYRFCHGGEYTIGRWQVLGCYHPSQQNTFTGRLTPAMMDTVLARARALIEAKG
ncbi:MAG: uracil-DNA glycosylase [Terriglobales bacterium]